MAQFDIPQVTRVGAALMAKILAGSGKIEFTYLTIGDAEYTAKQKTDAALQERTALKNQRMSFPFSSVTIKDETNVCLKAVVSNEKVTESFYITEMGIWAKDASDESSSPILYSIITASVGDYLPVYNGSVPSTIEEIWYTTISNKAEITIPASATAFALADDLNEHVDSAVSSREGVHGLRYYNDRFQVKNSEGVFVDTGLYDLVNQIITKGTVTVPLVTENGDNLVTENGDIIMATKRIGGIK